MRAVCGSLALAAILEGCAGALSPIAPSAPHIDAAGAGPRTTTKIQHVVILIQENRTFDNLFATFPHADGATHGKIHTGATVPLAKRNLLDRRDVPHGYYNFQTDYDDRKLDGFDVSSAA